MGTRGWFRVHSFTGVITGLMLFVVCWSGTFATVSYEIDWLVTPERRATIQPDAASWGEIHAAARTHARGQDAELRSLHAPLYPGSTYIAWIGKADGSSSRLFIDPYTARVSGERSGFDVARFFRSFHMNLFMPETWGYYIVGATGITMLISMIAALYLYKRWWTRFFRFKGGTGRVFFSELHKATGLWSLWFVLLIAVTGIWYLIEIAASDLTGANINFRPPPAFDVPAGTAPLDELVAAVQKARPTLDIRTIAWAGEDEPQNNTVYFDGQDQHWLVRDRANKVYVTARDGSILFNQAASDLSPYWRWIDTVDPLHFGDFAGLTTKLIWFLFGLSLSGLILTGTYLHAKRLAAASGSARRHRWPGTIPAVAVTMAILLSTIYFGIAEARDAYGVFANGQMQFPELAPGVSAFLLAWIVLTLGIIALWCCLLIRPPMILTPDRAKTRPGTIARPRTAA